MSVAALEAQLAELKRCVADMERLDEWITDLGKKVRTRASGFSDVAMKSAWGGEAAREFGRELERAKRKVEAAADHAKSASSVIRREIADKQAEIVRTQVELVAARAWEALQRRLKEAT